MKLEAAGIEPAAVQDPEISPGILRRCENVTQSEDLFRRVFNRHTREHHHVGIGLMAPDQIQHRQADILFGGRLALLAGTPSTNRNPATTWIRSVRKDPHPPK
ncbi:hypothetical protein P7L64_26855 [Tistrella bauzanensis]|uniref:hypothetical protein n=1 Tax=Tistrella bauzanensis TaxID=657419 RepID=UPI00166F3B06|nr:hypothetical protein [Tistrella bauzanensis]